SISLKKHLPQLTVVMSDVSAAALALALENAARNEVEVEALCGDLLTPFAGRQADFVVSNPPYIGTGQLLSLQPEIRQFEPHLALFAGESGLECYERFKAQLHPYLRPGGRVWFELGDHQGEAVTSLFKSPQWKNGTVSNDWSGMERFFSLEKVD
ncbi:MAG: methyltransferase, partial [Verrucomicrobia bacterium]|nr:methyltransferase [Verrucomicrobiota bacterium]